MAKDYSYSPTDDGNSSQENNKEVESSQQGSFIEASFSKEDYSALISAETVQLENPSLPNYVDNIIPDTHNHDSDNDNSENSREVQVDEIRLEEEESNPIHLLEMRIRKQLILVHIICIVMAILSIGAVFLEVFPAVLVCLIYLRDDMNNRTAKYDRLLLTLTIANFVASLVSLFFNVVVIFILCTFTFFLASILFIFIIPYTFIFRFVSRELLLNRGYSSSSNLYSYNVNNDYPASPYLPSHLHPQHIQLHQLHQHHAMNSFHPYPHHSAHHVAHHNHHHHHSHHSHSGSQFPF